MQEPRTVLWSWDGHFGEVFCCTRSELRAPGNTYINMTSGFPAGSIKNIEHVCWVSHEEGFHIQVLVPFWLEAQLHAGWGRRIHSGGIRNYFHRLNQAIYLVVKSWLFRSHGGLCRVELKLSFSSVSHSLNFAQSKPVHLEGLVCGPVAEENYFRIGMIS